jgi:type II secretory pathway component PulK
LLTRIADCLHSRKGIALVVVMMVLAIALVLAVAVSFTIFTEIENTKR